MENTHGTRFLLQFLAGCCIIPAALVIGESQLNLGPAPYEICGGTPPPANVLVEDERYGLLDGSKNLFPAGYSCTWALQDGTTTTVATVDEARTVGLSIAFLVGAAGITLAATASRLAWRARSEADNDAAGSIF